MMHIYEKNKILIKYEKKRFKYLKVQYELHPPAPAS